MTKALLISEKTLKEQSSLCDNVEGKYIQEAVKLAQEQGLKGIVGAALLRKLESLVAEETIEESENAAYKELLGVCQDYLMYKSIAQIFTILQYKKSNTGLAKTTDENIELASWDELCCIRSEYQGYADTAARDLQVFLLDRQGVYPELCDNRCHDIRAHLRDAASCGIFLGGARGKRV